MTALIIMAGLAIFAALGLRLLGAWGLLPDLGGSDDER